MTDPLCAPARIHYFRTPVFDGEPCQCGQTIYSEAKQYHHTIDEDEPKPFDAANFLLTWAPLIESRNLGGGNDFGGFGGGASGGAGASGCW